MSSRHFISYTGVKRLTRFSEVPIFIQVSEVTLSTRVARIMLSHTSGARYGESHEWRTLRWAGISIGSEPTIWRFVAQCYIHCAVRVHPLWQEYGVFIILKYILICLRVDILTSWSVDNWHIDMSTCWHIGILTYCNIDILIYCYLYVSKIHITSVINMGGEAMIGG
jgi:hypothetical protein